MLEVDVEGQSVGSTGVVDLLLAGVAVSVDIGPKATDGSFDVPDWSVDELSTFACAFFNLLGDHGTRLFLCVAFLSIGIQLVRVHIDGPCFSENIG